MTQIRFWRRQPAVSFAIELCRCW